MHSGTWTVMATATWTRLPPTPIPNVAPPPGYQPTRYLYDLAALHQGHRRALLPSRCTAYQVAHHRQRHPIASGGESRVALLRRGTGGSCARLRPCPGGMRECALRGRRGQVSLPDWRGFGDGPNALRLRPRPLSHRLAWILKPAETFDQTTDCKDLTSLPPPDAGAGVAPSSGGP